MKLIRILLCILSSQKLSLVKVFGYDTNSARMETILLYSAFIIFFVPLFVYVNFHSRAMLFSFVKVVKGLGYGLIAESLRF